MSEGKLDPNVGMGMSDQRLRDVAPGGVQPRSLDTAASRPVSIGDLIEAHMDTCHAKLKRLHTIKQMLPSQPTYEQSEAMLWLLSRDLK